LAKALIEVKKRLFDEHTFDYIKSDGESIKLTLSDIEERLYDLSFDPNHPPELRWGAPMGSEERASAREQFTPVSGGARVAMEDAYRLQSYYRTVAHRETEPSFLRSMFTENFPVRKKIDGQLAKWVHYNEPTEAITALYGNGGTGRKHGDPPHVLVPTDESAIVSSLDAGESGNSLLETAGTN
jgi:hypothetical protein